MGYLVTLLALARLFAPEPSATPADTDPSAAAATAEDDGLLRPVVFLPRALPLQASPRDLRNPFDGEARTVKTSASTRPSTKRAAKADLRDPFSDAPHQRRRFDAAPDLRDPFVQPKRSLPKCPDTGGVPIQRPDGAEPGCKQASRRRTVLAHR